MVTTETTLNGILSAWGMDGEPDPSAMLTQNAESPAPGEHNAGQDKTADATAPSLSETEPAAQEDGFGAGIGRRLLGNACNKNDVAGGANRIVELCRKHPVRPYLVEGGGRGFTTPNGWGTNETNWAVIKEFEQLWWSAAGDAVVERFGDRLPTICRECRELERAEQASPPE